MNELIPFQHLADRLHEIMTPQEFAAFTQTDEHAKVCRAVARGSLFRISRTQDGFTVDVFSEDNQ